MRKLLTALAALCFLAGCGSSSVKSDMSGYEGFEDTEHVFYDMSVKDAAEAMDEGKTFAVYFGFAKCPWCIAVLPILNETAKEAGLTVGYVDTRKDPSWQSNIDIDDYDLFTERFGEYLDYDDNGILHLYTPHVFFIRDGKTVFEHSGSLEGHIAYEREMSQEEKEELREIYRQGFQAMK